MTERILNNPKSDSLTLPVKELLPVLKLTQAFTATRDIVPALKFLYFQGDSVRAFSGEAGAVWYTPWKMPGEFAVAGETLVHLVDSLHTQGHDEVVFQVSAGTMELRAGGFRASLPLLSETERSTFMFRDPPTRPSVTLSEEFWTRVEQIEGSVCQDETLPMLRGVYWGTSGKYLISTDAFRITVGYLSEKTAAPAPQAQGLLLPAHLLARCRGRRREILGAALEGEGIVWLFFESGAVYGSLLQAEFPWKRSVELIRSVREGERARGTWVTLPEGLPVEQAVERLLYLAESPTFRLSGEVGVDSLCLRVGREGPVAEERIPAQVRGPAGTFAVNGKLFREALTLAHRFWVDPGDSQDPLYFVSENRTREQIVLRLRG